VGRHHKEAQFYMIDCKFSDNMLDQPIFRVTYNDTTRNRPFSWGKRYYFSNLQKEGRQFDWLTDNLETAEGNLTPDKITPLWTFDEKWNPESVDGPGIIDFVIYKNEVLFKFDEQITVEGNPELRSDSDKTFSYLSGAGSNTLKFITDSEIQKKDLAGIKIVNDARILGSIASVNSRQTNFKIFKK
jgi:pectinesterase